MSSILVSRRKITREEGEWQLAAALGCWLSGMEGGAVTISCLLLATP
jgi:hypothetical protein